MCPHGGLERGPRLQGIRRLVAKPGMTPTPMNGRPTLSLTRRWMTPKPLRRRRVCLVTGHGPPLFPSRSSLRLGFSGPGGCRASFPTASLFLPCVSSWLGPPSFSFAATAKSATFSKDFSAGAISGTRQFSSLWGTSMTVVWLVDTSMAGP